MEKNNSNTVITSIIQKNDGSIVVKAVTLSPSRPDHKFVIEPSDMVPEKYWGLLLDNNRFEYTLSL